MKQRIHSIKIICIALLELYLISMGGIIQNYFEDVEATIWGQNLYSWAVILLFVNLIIVVLQGKVQIYIPAEANILFLIAALGYIIIEFLSGNIDVLVEQHALINILILFTIIQLLWTIIPSIKIISLIFLCIICIIGMINYYVLQFRGTPVVPWDIWGLQTVTSVIGGFSLKITFSMITAILACVTMINFLTVIKTEYNEKYVKYFHYRRYKFLKLVILGVLSYNLVNSSIDTDIWNVTNCYKKQGVVAGFSKFFIEMNYKKPLGYSEKECDNIINNMTSIPSANVENKAQNVIFIMNESFSDLSVINEELFKEDYMPYTHSLKNNTICGNLYVPVFGGGTCNTEFEVLTGMSCAYVGGTPYEMYINNNIRSSALFFEKEGYNSIALHPFTGTNWNRDKVYPMLGFEQFISMEDMEQIQCIRGLASDQYVYDETLGLTEAYDKLMLFNVTMQNHGGYENLKEQFKNPVDLSEYGDFPLAESYLTLVRESDKALKKFIHQLKRSDEPTIVCFFGDHQPAIEDEFYEQLYGQKIDSLTAQQQQEKFITPFFIWANYDIPETYIDKISANYLALFVQQLAGYDLEGYEAFLYQLYQKYPVISTTGVYDANGNFYENVKDVKEDKKDIISLETYKKLQYYRMKGN